jgi:hypothetical protein
MAEGECGVLFLGDAGICRAGAVLRFGLFDGAGAREASCAMVSRWLRRAIRWAVALLLFPVNLGLSRAVWDVGRVSVDGSPFWVPLLAGLGIWGVIYLQLPRPMWLYVLGHELTHALSAWMCGARVQSFEVSSRGGAVRLSRSNAFIALSPYFLPIYSLLWSLVMAGVHGRWGSAWWVLPLYQAGLGFTYGFHVTMTVVILRIRQPDLVGEGFLFSASLIWLGNALILLLGMSWLAGRPGVGTALRWAARHSADIASGAWQMAERWVR